MCNFEEASYLSMVSVHVQSLLQKRTSIIYVQGVIRALTSTPQIHSRSIHEPLNVVTNGQAMMMQNVCEDV